jgi:DNA-binding NtrC family response regulator
VAPEHVLLVDDDPGYLETLCPYLRASGFCVTTADNGHDARQVATTGVFEAVVSDLRMADVSGIDLLHGLREAGVCVPFIIVSGYGTVELTARAMKLGATDFLEKPVDADVLVQVIRSAISVGCPRRRRQKSPTRFLRAGAWKTSEVRSNDCRRRVIATQATPGLR